MYNKGDILVDFKRRILFEFPGMENFDLKILYKCRLATPGETMIFKREFKGKKSVSFAEFKEEMPVFDGRRMRAVVYGYIPLTESDYKFFRSMKTKFIHSASFSEKLSELIDNWLRRIEHNIEDDPELEKLKQLRKLLAELLTDQKK